MCAKGSGLSISRVLSGYGLITYLRRARASAELVRCALVNPGQGPSSTPFVYPHVVYVKTQHHGETSTTERCRVTGRVGIMRCGAQKVRQRSTYAGRQTGASRTADGHEERERERGWGNERGMRASVGYKFPGKIETQTCLVPGTMPAQARMEEMECVHWTSSSVLRHQNAIVIPAGISWVTLPYAGPADT